MYAFRGKLGGRNKPDGTMVRLIWAAIRIQQDFSTGDGITEVWFANIALTQTGFVKVTLNTVLPAPMIVPGSIARVKIVPEEGAVKTVSCKSSSA